MVQTALAPNVTAISADRLGSASLPEAGEGRFWRVEHNPKSRTNPITVKLMEYVVPGRTVLSRQIGFDYTIASWKAVSETAELILAKVGDYAKVIGDYQTDVTEKSEIAR